MEIRSILVLSALITCNALQPMANGNQYNKHGGIIKLVDGKKTVTISNADHVLFKHIKKTKSFEDLVDPDLYKGSAKGKSILYTYADNNEIKESIFTLPNGLQINNDHESIFSVQEDKYEEYHLFFQKNNEKIQIGSTMAFWNRLKDKEIKEIEENKIKKQEEELKKKDEELKKIKEEQAKQPSWYSGLITSDNIIKVTTVVWENRETIKSLITKEEPKKEEESYCIIQ